MTKVIYPLLGWETIVYPRVFQRKKRFLSAFACLQSALHQDDSIGTKKWQANGERSVTHALFRDSELALASWFTVADFTWLHDESISRHSPLQDSLSAIITWSTEASLQRERLEGASYVLAWSSDRFRQR